jgi:DNA adenine methylase
MLKRTHYARREFEQAFVATTATIIRAQRAIVRAYMAFHHTALFKPGKCCFASASHRNGEGCKAHE